MSDEVVPYVDPHRMECLPVASQGLVPSEQELQVYLTIASQATESKYYQRLSGSGGKAAIVSIMLYAREVGVGPMTALSGAFNNIDGKIEASAGLISQKIREAGHLMQIQVSTDKECSIWGKRRDTGEELTVTMTWDMAVKAGWAEKQNWKKYPDDMLFSRAISKLKRRLFPEVLSGAYVAGEIQESVDFPERPPRGSKPQPKPAATKQHAKEDPPPPEGTTVAPPQQEQQAEREKRSTSDLRPEVSKKLSMAENYLKSIKVDGKNYAPEQIDRAFNLLLQHFQVIDANDLTDDQLKEVMPFVKSDELKAALGGGE